MQFGGLKRGWLGRSKCSGQRLCTLIPAPGRGGRHRQEFEGSNTASQRHKNRKQTMRSPGVLEGTGLGRAGAERLLGVLVEPRKVSGRRLQVCPPHQARGAGLGLQSLLPPLPRGWLLRNLRALEARCVLAGEPGATPLRTACPRSVLTQASGAAEVSGARAARACGQHSCPHRRLGAQAPASRPGLRALFPLTSAGHWSFAAV